MSAMLANGSYYTADNYRPSQHLPPRLPCTSTNPSGSSVLHASHSLRDADSTLQPVKYQQYTPAEPPAGMSYLAFLRTWTDDDVLRWLTEIKCNSHSDAFKANDIRGDILLELDQMTLKEMGIISIGDRLRILNAVKLLRQRVANKGPAPSALAPTHKANSSVDYDSKGSSDKADASGTRPGKSRLENVRPAPLQLNANAHRGDLPAIIREQPDSARSVATSNPPIRPLPLPTNLHHPPTSPGPSSAPSASSRTTPLPPSALQRSHNWTAAQQQEAPPYTSQPPPPPPQSGHLTPSTNNGSITTSLPILGPAIQEEANRRLPGLSPPSLLPASARPTSRMRAAIPGPRTGRRPTSGRQATRTPTPSASSLHPPTQPSQRTCLRLMNLLSASFAAHSIASTQGYTVGRGPKLVKFILPDDGHSSTIDVASCTGGVEVLEKTEEGGLVVDGWGVYMDMGGEDGPAQPLTEAELLRPQHQPRLHHHLPQHETRQLHQRPQRPRRARPRARARGPRVHGRLSPASQQNAKRPSKLRSFFGQRPPSELITTHLTEFFPNTEKKVLQRTARHSMMRRRESVASYSQPMARYSGSQSSGGRRSYSPRSSISTIPPPVPEKPRSYETAEDLPRMSLSTEDGRSVDLPLDEERTPQLLPPIPFPTESLTESIEGVTRRQSSRTLSTASKRMSYMTELRSKRDRSDTASLMTVDEITAEVENRVSKDREEDLDGWTKVDSEIENIVPKAVADSDSDVDAEAETSDVDTSDDDVDDEDETLHEEEELSLDVDEDGCIRNVINAKTANKWIKGALIGAGSFGKVYLGMDASNGLLMAVKQVELPTGSAPNQERKKSMLSALEREIELLKNLQHENIVQYLYSSIDDEYLNIFLEYVPGGSVTALLRNYGAFEEPLVKNFVRQILQGLDYLHERDIIHRDIKGANILVDNKGGIKISDFGISKKTLNGQPHQSAIAARLRILDGPEVVKQTGHTRKADIWSMQAIFKIGSSARPTIPSDISADAQDFLRRTFEIDHEARPSAAELLQHAWVVPPKTK
ncbi:ste11-like protein [Pholiota molesta]|nr:ste11-like protein [Pholiota molesta]